MQPRDIVKYINDPQLLSKESIPELQKLVNDFPYFQSGHILLSLASKKWDASVYQQSIKKTAIVVSNRAHLYSLLHKPAIAEQQEQTETRTIVKEEKTEKKVEPVVITEEVKPLDEPVVVKEEVKPIAKIEKVDEEKVEQEIEKALVNSFVEKELLKIKQEKPVEPGNFGDWLQFLKKNNGQPYSDIVQQVKNKAKNIEKLQEEDILKSKQKQKALIDKIIESNPGPIRQKEEQKFFKSDIKAKESLLENEHLITETLAQIYALQGNINKAIRAYEILSLKYPQKSVYFASLIQKLKDKQ